MEARRPSNHNHAPSGCQCRCPCHSAQNIANSNTAEGQGGGEVFSNGMSWAEGAVRFSVPPTPTNDTSSGNNPFRRSKDTSANPKPINATECFSKSLLHVKNMVRTMTARFESMSEDADGDSRRNSRDEGTTPSQCLACTSSHRWSTGTEPELHSTNSGEIRRSLGIDDRKRSFGVGRGDQTEPVTYSLEPLRFNENLPIPPQKDDETNADKRRSSDKGSSPPPPPPPIPPRKDSYELKKAVTQTQTSSHEIKDSRESTAETESQTPQPPMCPYYHPTNPFAKENVLSPQEVPKDEPKPCPCSQNQNQQIQIKQLEKVSRTQAGTPSKQTTCFTQLAQEDGKRCEFYKIVNEHEVNASKSALSNTAFCGQQRPVPDVHKLEKGILFMLCNPPEPGKVQAAEVVPDNVEKRVSEPQRRSLNMSSEKINSGESVGLSRCSTAVLTSFIEDIIDDAHQVVASKDANKEQATWDEQETIRSTDTGDFDIQDRKNSLEKDQNMDAATLDFTGFERTESDEDDETIMTKILSLRNVDDAEDDQEHETIITRMMSFSEDGDKIDRIDSQEKVAVENAQVASYKSKDKRESIDISSDKSVLSSGERVNDDGSSYMAWISVPISSGDEQQDLKGSPLIDKGLISLEIGSNPPIRTAIPMSSGATVLIRLSEEYDSLVQHPSTIQIETVARSISQTNMAAKKILHHNRKRVEAAIQSGAPGECHCPINNNKRVDESTMTSVVMAMHCQTKQFHICHKCQKIVSKDEGRFHIVGDHYTAWHPQCFKCNECEKELVGNDYNFFDEEPYCMQHFLKEANIPKCSKCGELIFDKSYTSAGGKDWHKKHFYCYSCRTTLVDTKFVLAKRRFPYCLNCHEKEFSKICKACLKQIHIHEPYVETGEFYWHSNESCLRCSTCDGSLIGRPFLFRRDSQLYCNRYCGVRET